MNVMKETISGLWIGVALLVLWVQVAAGAVPLPYRDGFEAYTAGNPLPTGNAWITNGSGSVTVVATNANPTLVFVGEKACVISNDVSLKLNVDTSKGVYTNVWWSFYTMPVRCDDDGGLDPPTNGTGSSAAFYVNTAGVVMVYCHDGQSNTWTNLPSVTVNSNTWIGFAANIHYGTASNWDLWITTNATVQPSATTQIGFALRFATNATVYTELNDVMVYNNCSIDKFEVYLPPAAGGGPGLPFFDGFESYPLGPLTNFTTIWSLTGDQPMAMVTNNPYIEGVHGLHATNANLTLNIDENKGNYTNVWCQFYLKMVGNEDDEGLSPPLVSVGAAAACYVSTNGILRAYADLGTTNDWTNLLTGVSTSAWIGISMHIDYSTRKWDLYYTTNTTYGSPMRKLNVAPLGIQTNAGAEMSISEIVIQNNFDLDAVGVSLSPLAVTTNLPLTPTQLVSQVILGGSTNIIGVPAHHYAFGEDTMAGQLGKDLSSGLENGDKIRIFSTNRWNEYVLEDGEWKKKMESVPATLQPSNMHVNAGMGLFVWRMGTTNTMGFYPYDTVPSFTNTVYGTNQELMVGWNLLAWPFLTAANQSQWGFTPATNDLIYVLNGRNYTQLWWDPREVEGSRWKIGRNTTTMMLQRGQGLWYYHAGTNMQWTAIAPPAP